MPCRHPDIANRTQSRNMQPCRSRQWSKRPADLAVLPRLVIPVVLSLLAFPLALAVPWLPSPLLLLQVPLVLLTQLAPEILLLPSVLLALSVPLLLAFPVALAVPLLLLLLLLLQVPLGLLVPWTPWVPVVLAGLAPQHYPLVPESLALLLSRLFQWVPPVECQKQAILHWLSARRLYCLRY
jgi:hypothetical protein